LSFLLLLIVAVAVVVVVVGWKVSSTSTTTAGAAATDGGDIMLIVVMNRIDWFCKPCWMDDGERASVVGFVVFGSVAMGADGYVSTHASTGTAGGVREVCDDSFAPMTPRAATCRTLFDLATTFVRVLKIWTEEFMVKVDFCFLLFPWCFALIVCWLDELLCDSMKFCETISLFLFFATTNS